MMLWAQSSGPWRYVVAIAAVLAVGVLKQTEARAPDVFTARFNTTVNLGEGSFDVEVHRQWAPIGADRLYELLHSHYFDNSAFFRVLPMFVVQFGIAGDPEVSAQWKNERIDDDPVAQSNRRWRMSFATSGENSRTTQLFINMADNTGLDASGFAPIGEVVRGARVLRGIYSGYGEEPAQAQIYRKGNQYLHKSFPKLDYITRARALAPPATAQVGAGGGGGGSDAMSTSSILLIVFGVLTIAILVVLGALLLGVYSVLKRADWFSQVLPSLYTVAPSSESAGGQWSVNSVLEGVELEEAELDGGAQDEEGVRE